MKPTCSCEPTDKMARSRTISYYLVRQTSRVNPVEVGQFKTAGNTTVTRRRINKSFKVFLDAVDPGKLANAGQEVGNSKVRKGLWVVESVTSPSEMIDLNEQITTLHRHRGLGS